MKSFIRIIILFVLSTVACIQAQAQSEQQLRQIYQNQRREINSKIQELRSSIARQQADINEEINKGASQETLEREIYFLNDLKATLARYENRLADLENEMNREIGPRRSRTPRRRSKEESKKGTIGCRIENNT